MILIELLYNLSVLVALSVLSAFLDSRFDRESSLGKSLQGLLFGLIAVIGMIYPLTLLPGVIFDGRTVVISLCSLFYGPFAGMIAALSAMVYRLFLGGPGIHMGIATIGLSWAVGLSFYRLKHRQTDGLFSKSYLYLMGLLVHIGMLGCFFLLPPQHWQQTFRSVGLTVIIFYPLVTVLIGKILIDEMERKQHLKAYWESAEKYRTTLDSIGDAVIATDDKGRVEFLNPAAERLTGSQQEKARGRPLESICRFISEDSREPVKDPSNRLFKEKPLAERPNSLILISENGREVPVADSGALIKDASGKINGLVLILRDITEQKEASFQVIRDLEEKKALLREVHHRVKNNMQVIISLFHLRMGKVQDEKAKTVFQDMENRIHTMARAQELLHKSDNFSRLDLHSYLQDVIDHVLFSAGEVSTRIRVNTEISSVYVDADTAITLGQIVTELLTNTYKYAFPGKKAGTVNIAVFMREKEIVFKFADDGVGINPEIKLEEAMSTGLQIVFGYVHSRKDASISYSSANGLSYTLVFPLG